jgi:HlyD family secretion protein
MLKEIKPRLVEKATAFLPDSLQKAFNEDINNEESYNPANFKKELPSNYDGFFYKDKDEKLDFQFIEIGIKSGLESEIKRFLGGTALKEGDKVINSIKSDK